MSTWIAFVVCTSLIVYSGTKLARYGDILAEKTGLGRSWIGLVLMASVTSLPEMVTGLSSVTYAGVPDIAVGDVLGSCVFNLAILGLIGLLGRTTSLPPSDLGVHILSLGFGMVLLGIAGTGLFLGPLIPAIAWFGFYTPLIILVYFLAIRRLFFFQKRQKTSPIEDTIAALQYEKISTRKSIFIYGLNAAVVILAAVFLPKIGEILAETTGLGQTFVGNLLMALSTSLPEVVVSMASLRIGALSLAVGNLIGSNMFNIMILSLDDLFFLKGPMLSFVHHNQAISALSAIMMSAVAMIGLITLTKNKEKLPRWISIALLTIFLGNSIVLYLSR